MALWQHKIYSICNLKPLPTSQNQHRSLSLCHVFSCWVLSVLQNLAPLNSKMWNDQPKHYGISPDNKLFALHTVQQKFTTASVLSLQRSESARTLGTDAFISQLAAFSFNNSKQNQIHRPRIGVDHSATHTPPTILCVRNCLAEILGRTDTKVMFIGCTIHNPDQSWHTCPDIESYLCVWGTRQIEPTLFWFWSWFGTLIWHQT